MTPTERNAKLEEVREALAKATAAPWHLDGPIVCGDDTYADIEGASVARIMEEKDDGVFCQEIPRWQSDANARLIVNAPAWLAFLLGEVERLQMMICGHHPDSLRDEDNTPANEVRCSACQSSINRAAAERESCAKVAESATSGPHRGLRMDEDGNVFDGEPYYLTATPSQIAQIIRARK